MVCVWRLQHMALEFTPGLLINNQGFYRRLRIEKVTEPGKNTGEFNWCMCVYHTVLALFQV